jgi:hypothetical protein
MNITVLIMGERAQKNLIQLKIAPVNTLIDKMLVYSAIKIKAKGPAAYSILNPDTNSDSPSAKSKGARLVSAKTVTTHTIIKGGSKISNQTFPIYTKKLNLALPNNNKQHKKKTAILIS